MLGSQLMRVWPRVEATFATVEAHTSHIDVIDHGLVVHVGDVHAAKVGNRPVVVEGTTTPVAALKTNTAVPISVVDSTVKPYVGTPIAGVPEIRATAPAPVTRCPQEARCGGHNPCARHPVIIALVISPVARCPDITNCGAGWLLIHRQFGGCDVDGDADRHEREGRHRQCRQRETRQNGSGRIEAMRFLIHDDLVAIVV
jgi:hypothetical protein